MIEKYIVGTRMPVFGKDMEILFPMGTPFTFDGDYVTVQGQEFIGFRSGQIYIYLDETCRDFTCMNEALDPSCLIGAKILAVKGLKEGDTKVDFVTTMGTLRMEHIRNCCECVELLDLNGDESDLVGGIIQVFECRMGYLDGKSFKQKRVRERTYTFYTVRTTKGDATFRWGLPENEDSQYGQAITLHFV